MAGDTRHRDGEKEGQDRGRKEEAATAITGSTRDLTSPFVSKPRRSPQGATNSPSLKQKGKVHRAVAPREARQQHVEASGAVPREAGVAAPRAPPSNVNDYPTQVSPSLPGGRLSYFVTAWESVTSDQWVLDTITKEYRLEFSASLRWQECARKLPFQQTHRSGQC